jgi:hypothetical protein
VEVERGWGFYHKEPSELLLISSGITAPSTIHHRANAASFCDSSFFAAGR